MEMLNTFFVKEKISYEILYKYRRLPPLPLKYNVHANIFIHYK